MPASVFLVHTYEATNLILNAIRHGAVSGRDVRAYLEQTKNLPALTGPAEFGPEGVLRRNLYLLQVNEQGALSLARE